VPNWHEILNEVKRNGSTFDSLRRKYLQKLQSHTKRNVIIYYSGWLEKPGLNGVQVNDSDKNGFMTVIQQARSDQRLGLGSSYTGWRNICY
jgi:hypothetical protein